MAHDQLSRRRWLESVSIIGLSLLAPSGVRTAVAQSSPQSYLDALRAGGCVILVRHALTTSGIGDPLECGSTIARANAIYRQRVARNPGGWVSGLGLMDFVHRP